MTTPMFQPGVNVYSQGFGSAPENIQVPHYDVRAPTNADTNYPIGKVWVWPGNSSYRLLGLVTQNNITTATWAPDNSIALAITGASPLTLNSRVGSATFTGVSIAAGATETFVINNSTITGASTIVNYSIVGATAGSELTIQSVTNAAGTSTVVVQNGTGATTDTANLTLTYQVLN